MVISPFTKFFWHCRTIFCGTISSIGNTSESNNKGHVFHGTLFQLPWHPLLFFFFFPSSNFSFVHLWSLNYNGKYDYICIISICYCFGWWTYARNYCFNLDTNCQELCSLTSWYLWVFSKETSRIQIPLSQLLNYQKNIWKLIN